MTEACAKKEDVMDIRSDVKEIKEMLQTHLIESAVTKKEVELHTKLWTGLIGVVVSIGVFFTQKYFTKG